MAQIILNSAENSALLQTLQQSDSKTIPSIYSTKEVYAPSATSWFNQSPSQSQAVVAGSTLTYDLNKYGILEQMLFTFSATVGMTPSAANFRACFPSGYIYQLIERIDFLSSSRVISTIFSEDLRAQHSNLSNAHLAPIVQSAIGRQTSGQTGNNADVFVAQYCVPVVWGFLKDINTCPNLSFMESCQVRFTFRDPLAVNEVNLTTGVQQVAPAGTTVAVLGGGTSPTGGSPANTFPTLMVRYKQYGEADTAQLLAENYNSEQLNMLTSRCYRENPVSFSVASGASTTVKQVVNVDLKNVDVVKGFYIFVTKTYDGTSGAPTDNVFLRSANMCYEIESIRMTASGQEICNINTTQNSYMKLTENGYAVNGVAEGVTQVTLQTGKDINNLQLYNIYKIQTGLYENDGGGAWSNGWSLREMTNCRIEITLPVYLANATGLTHANKGRIFLPANGTTQYSAFVVEDCSTILSTASNTGRTVNSLTN